MFAIEVRDLFHIYPSKSGGIAAIRGLSFAVKPGEVCVVRGPNGSGKSTLTEILAGTIQPSAGLVKTNGNLRRLRQFGNVIPELSVAEYIGIATSKFEQVMKLWKLQAYKNQKLVSLTPGIQQLVSAAAALAGTPSILLADEPAGALSKLDAIALYEQMTSHCRANNVALVLVTHDKNAEQFADRIVRISDGRLGEEWTPNSAEQTLIDQHGWLRLPRELGVAVPTKARIKRENSTFVLEGLELAPVTQRINADNSDSNECLISIKVPENPAGRFANLEFELQRGQLATISGASDLEKAAVLRGLIGQDPAFDFEIAQHGVTRLFSKPVGQDLSAIEAGASLEWTKRLEIEKYADRPMRTLSGGQLQKAQLAIAFSQQTDVLLLDEPTSALDEDNRHLVAEIIATLDQMALIIATQDDYLISAANHKVLIE